VLVLTACAPTPTPPTFSLPTQQPTFISPTVQTPVEVGKNTTPAPTPSATLSLSANAEQELVTIRNAARAAQGGFLFYLDAPGRTSNPQVLQVSRDQPFEGVVLAGNYGVKEHEFALLCIVDYVQTPCHSDAQEPGFRFRLGSQVETRQQVSIPLDPGAHDLLFLTFYDPSNHSSEQVFRQESRFLFSFYRVQIMVGGNAAPPSPNIAQKFSTQANLQSGAAFFTIRRDKFVDPSQTPWHQEQVAPDAPLDFITSYSNPEQVTRTVALMAFMDFEQVPWDSTHTTFFAELDAGARADIQALVSAPTITGDHELMVVAVDNPFLDLAAQVDAAPPPRSFFANSSDRVLINVR
jgi:hypothetical protein